jgi:hypothetical protein
MGNAGQTRNDEKRKKLFKMTDKQNKKCKYSEIIESFFKKEHLESAKARFYDWLWEKEDDKEKIGAIYEKFEQYIDKREIDDESTKKEQR